MHMHARPIVIVAALFENPTLSIGVRLELKVSCAVAEFKKELATAWVSLRLRKGGK